MVAKATALLPPSTTPTVGDAVELAKASTPRGFQVNLTGKDQVAAALQLQSSLDGTNFFSVKDINIGGNNGFASKGFYLSGEYGPLTRAVLLNITGENASVEVLTS